MRIFKTLYKGRVFAKTNNYKRSKGSFYLPKKVTKSIQDFQSFILPSLPPSPATSPVCVTIRFFYKDNRKRDIDNPIKSILDALNGLVYVDDSQVVKLKVYKHVKQKQNAVFVEVRKCGKH